MNVLSWGSNSHGQLSLGFTSEQEETPAVVKVFCNSDIQITGGGNETLLLTRKGVVYAAGCNDASESGLNHKCQNSNFVLIAHPFSVKISKVSCGWNFNVCVLEDGRVIGWGSNSFGQLGFRGVKVIREPSLLLDQYTYIDVSCGLRHTLLIDVYGYIYGSGSNRKGQLGKSYQDSKGFQEVAGLKEIKFVICGENSSAALSHSGIVYAWGDNKFGQCAKSPARFKTVPEPTIVDLYLPKNDKVQAIYCGWSNCAVLTEEGIVYTWGRNDYGQLGDPCKLQPYSPTKLITNFKFKSIALGSQHTIALTKCNQIVSWGWNEHGSCGDGTLDNIDRPTNIQLLPNFKPLGVGAGAAHSFVWGLNTGETPHGTILL